MRYGFGNTFDRILPRLHSASNVQPNQVCHPFITQHNLVSGQTMGARQQSAVCGFTTAMSGIGTPNGNDLLTKFYNSNTKIWLLCPINDTDWSFETYALELFSGGSFTGTYNNFLLVDGSINGVKGGSGKWFNALTGTGNAFAYNRSTITAQNGVFGVREGNSIHAYRAFPSSVTYSCPTVFGSQIPVNPLIDKTKGFIAIQSKGVTQQLIQNDTILFNASRPSPSITLNYYFNGVNLDGVSLAYSSDAELSMYGLRFPFLTQAEIEDLNFAIQQYQTNVTPLGRNV